MTNGAAPTGHDMDTRLRLLVADHRLAADLGADPAIRERCQLQVRPGLRAVVAAARNRTSDAVVLAAQGHRSYVAAVVARALGLCVWWLDPDGRRSPGVGAPARSSSEMSLRDFEAVAAMSGHPGAGHRDGPVVSVVVTTLNEGAALDRLILRVVAQLGDADELVVIDGGSADGSIERVHDDWREEKRVRIEVRPGLGISAGRNAGVRVASNDIIVCTDAGCDPAPGWIEAMRQAFSGTEPPGLASGPYTPVGGGPLAHAQAVACYPDPDEVSRPDLAVRVYTKLFGTGFRPEFAIGRNVAFTRSAWANAGGFPEHLPTGEDVSFGLAVARRHRCVGTSRARVTWRQREDVAATWKMYRSYGRASTDGGDRRLLVRDCIRGAAYLIGALASLTPSGRKLVAGGAVLYLSVPVRRARRSHLRLASYPLLPVALAIKDLGKLAGALEGLVRVYRKPRR